MLIDPDGKTHAEVSPSPTSRASRVRIHPHQSMDGRIASTRPRASASTLALR